MVDFWERRADVLVCTTIVEAGLDISTANTLLIERADLLGLSQLHQLRGRVGRGRERGYAYFLYPPEKPLTETAHDRLATIAAHTDLGAGHGGGDEGPGDPRRRQHARRRAVRAHRRRRLRPLHPAGRRGGRGVPRPRTPSPRPDVRIELPIDAHLPEDYVESERLRLEMYKRLAEVRAEARPGRGPRGAGRPLRAAADRGGDAAGRGPVPAARPGGRADRHRQQRQLHPLRARPSCSSRASCG